MAAYCNTKGCPVVSLNGIGPTVHGKRVHCPECGRPLSATRKGK